MATFLYIFSWIFTIRPISWLIEKIFKKNELIRSIALEIHFFLIALLHTILLISGIDKSSPILIIGIVGLLCLSFELSIDTAGSMDEVSRTHHDGYDAYVSGDHVTVRERTKEKLSGTTVLFLLFAPFNVLIRFINLLLSFKTLSADSKYICLLGHYGHCTDNPFKRIFVDTVLISEYCSYHGFSYEGFMQYQREHGFGPSRGSSGAPVYSKPSSSSSMHDGPKGYIGFRPDDPDDITIIPWTADDGRQFNMELWDVVLYDDGEFAVMHPDIPEAEDDGVFIFRIWNDANGDPDTLDPVKDWALSDAVYDKYISEN